MNELNEWLSICSRKSQDTCTSGLKQAFHRSQEQTSTDGIGKEGNQDDESMGSWDEVVDILCCFGVFFGW